MNRRVLVALLAAGFVGGGALFLGRSGHLTDGGGAFAANAAVWSVGTTTDKLDGMIAVEADMEQRTGNGGVLDVAANCNPTVIQITFEYHAKRDADSALTPANGYGDIALRYQLDNGEVRGILRHANYKNVAFALFTYEVQRAPANSSEAIANATGRLMWALMPAAGPQNLRALLHANIVRFEVPLGDGTSEIVAFSPKENSFRSFLGACKIDLARLDADAAKSAKAAADRDAKERAAEAERQRQREMFADMQRRADKIKDACRQGEQPLRIEIAAALQSAEGTNNSPPIPVGQIVTTIANDDDPLGRCEVEYTDGGTRQQGFLSTTVLEPADEPPPPPLHIDN